MAISLTIFWGKANEITKLGNNMDVNRKKATCVSFGFRADELDTSEITATMGIIPSRGFRRGDPFISRGVEHKKLWGIWVLDTHISSNSVDRHLEELLHVLDPRKEAIRAINSRHGFQSLLKIFWLQTDITIGLSIKGRLLSQAAAYADIVDITIRESDNSDATNPDPLGEMGRIDATN